MRADEFAPGSTPDLVTFGFSQISPPSSVYIQRDDILVLQAATQTGGEVVIITIRLLIPSARTPGQPSDAGSKTAAGSPMVGPGYIQTIQRQLSLPNAFTSATLSVPLAEGYLLSVTATANIAAQRSLTFARCWINRGNLSFPAPSAAMMLFADSVVKLGAIGWPAGRIIAPSEGPGLPTRFTINNPAAGVDFSGGSNQPGRVRLQSLTALFTAGAGVGNRIISFRFISASAGTFDYQVQDTVAVTAGQVIQYSLGPGTSASRGAGAATAGNPICVTLPLPGVCYCSPGFIVSSVTQGILAADQWSGIQLADEEWLDVF